MNDDNRKQYWEGLCNRTQNLYASMNQIRAIAIIFGISLGALLIAQGPDYKWGGLMTMLAMLGLFNYLSSQATNQWLYYRNIDLWLRIGDTNRNFESDYRMSIPSFYDLIFHRMPKKEELKDAQVIEGRDWKEAWIRILATEKRFERRLQTLLHTVCIVLIVLTLVIPNLI